MSMTTKNEIIAGALQDLANIKKMKSKEKGETKMKLIRVPYGKADTPTQLREYKIDGHGPVGTLAEFKDNFQGETFEIVDNISGKHPQDGTTTIQQGEKLAFDATKKKQSTFYNIQAHIDDGGAFVQLVDKQTKKPISPTFQVTKKKLDALKEIAEVR